MSTTKSRRRRLLLLLGAFLLLAGAATATTLALRPPTHPVAAPRRETTTGKTYPAVSLPLPEDARDGVQPSPLSPTCSPGGKTCIVGEANVRTGAAHLLLSDNGGKTWLPAAIPPRPGTLGSAAVWSFDQLACTKGECFAEASANERDTPSPLPAASAVWACAIRDGTAQCTEHAVAPLRPGDNPPWLYGVACPGSACYLLGTTGNGGDDLVLWRLSSSGTVAGLAGLEATPDVTGGCTAHARAHIACRPTVLATGGVVGELACSRHLCAAAAGLGEITWRLGGAAPVRPDFAVVRDETLGGAHSPVPVSVRVSGTPGTTEGVCDAMTWCVNSVDVLPGGGATWSLTSGRPLVGRGGTFGPAKVVALKSAWLVRSPGGQWSVTAHRPKHAALVLQPGGGVSSSDRWCGTRFCVVLHVRPPASFAVQRVPVRAAGTKDERAK